MTSIEAKFHEATETINFLQRLVTTLRSELHKARVERAACERKYILKECGLPEDAKQRLDDAFKTSTDNAGLKQAINCEKRGAE